MALGQISCLEECLMSKYRGAECCLNFAETIHFWNKLTDILLFIQSVTPNSPISLPWTIVLFWMSLILFSLNSFAAVIQSLSLSFNYLKNLFIPAYRTLNCVYYPLIEANSIQCDSWHIWRPLDSPNSVDLKFKFSVPPKNTFMSLKFTLLVPKVFWGKTSSNVANPRINPYVQYGEYSLIFFWGKNPTAFCFRIKEDSEMDVGERKVTPNCKKDLVFVLNHSTNSLFSLVCLFLCGLFSLAFYLPKHHLIVGLED